MITSKETMSRNARTHRKSERIKENEEEYERRKM
jgi:hypothetical protein